MATTSNPTEPRVDASTNFDEIWKEAVGRYEKDTGTKFKDLDEAKNADDVLTQIQEREEKFKGHRHNRSKTDKFRTLVSKALDPIDRLISMVAGLASTVRTEVLPIC